MSDKEIHATGGETPVTAKLIAEIKRAITHDDQDRLRRLLEPIHAADIADLLEQIDPDLRDNLVALWKNDFDGEVLSELSEPLQAEVVAQLPAMGLAQAVRDLSSDDIVDLTEDLHEDLRATILDALDDPDRAAVEQSLRCPAETAGRLMQREIVMVPAHWDVGQAIDHLRADTNLPEQFYHLILTDPKAQFKGMVSLSRLMGSVRTTRLVEIIDDDCHPIDINVPQDEVAYIFNQYHLISAPVIDTHNRVTGIITIDDAMTLLDAEAEQDILRLAGVGDKNLSEKVINVTRQRFPWLIVNLATAVVASLVIDRFSETIEALVALAVLMPIVASMGGNAGTQSLTVAVRSLATRDLTRSNARRIIWRETGVGLLNGLLFAAIAGLIGLIWFGAPLLGAVMGLAMIITMTAAGIAGILIPIGLNRTRMDPALASGVFVTTVTDCVGFLAFLGLAALILL
ncbi:MAG: magnesium transporter [Rhodobacteraceae bacterium]|nr:magnesium transporter [Paracoccaceae bacterium]MCY4197202.1 magnesium transporter [Paracoccaceae bacterium]